MKASDNETVAEIMKRVRRDCNSYPLPTAAAEMLKLVREIDEAHRREVAELQRRLKLAEDALGESRVAVCLTCNKKHICGHGTEKFDPCCIYKDIDNALAAIREANEAADQVP